MKFKQNIKSAIGELITTGEQIIIQFREAVVQRCSVRKVFSEISQNSQENTCARMKTPLVAASELK